jgi:hypothetical protein
MPPAATRYEELKIRPCEFDSRLGHSHSDKDLGARTSPSAEPRFPARCAGLGRRRNFGFRAAALEPFIHSAAGKALTPAGGVLGTNYSSLMASPRRTGPPRDTEA